MSTPGRMGRMGRKSFPFKSGDLVLVKWDDGMVYFAKIRRVDLKKEKCTVIFDDKSRGEADFYQIHSVDETTTDIICIKCKKDDSDSPNEIVLCDLCGIGFHQKCHNPPIPASALQLDIPWNCAYCQNHIKCPYLTESLDVLQNLLSDDNESTTGDEDEYAVESDHDEVVQEEPTSSKHILRKRKRRKSSRIKNAKFERQKHTAPTPELSSLVTVERKSCLVASKNVLDDDISSMDSSSNSKSEDWSSSKDSSSTQEVVTTRKRKKHHSSGYQKRPKRSSVESRTVSVTRIDTPIYSNNPIFTINEGNSELSTGKETSPVLSPTEMETSSDVFQEDNPSKPGFDLPRQSPVKVKQRKFRVSLSLPEEVDTKSAIDSSEKSPLADSSLLPSWDNFSSTNSPKNSLKSPSVEKDLSISSKTVKDDPKTENEKEDVPFIASPLPTSSSSLKQLGIGLPEKINDVYSSTNMNVGVTGSSVYESKPCNPVIISSIKIPLTDDDDDTSATEPEPSSDTIDGVLNIASQPQNEDAILETIDDSEYGGEEEPQVHHETENKTSTTVDSDLDKVPSPETILSDKTENETSQSPIATVTNSDSVEIPKSPMASAVNFDSGKALQCTEKVSEQAVNPKTDQEILSPTEACAEQVSANLKTETTQTTSESSQAPDKMEMMVAENDTVKTASPIPVITGTPQTGELQEDSPQQPGKQHTRDYSPPTVTTASTTQQEVQSDKTSTSISDKTPVDNGEGTGGSSDLDVIITGIEPSTTQTHKVLSAGVQSESAQSSAVAATRSSPPIDSTPRVLPVIIDSPISASVYTKDHGSIVQPVIYHLQTSGAVPVTLHDKRVPQVVQHITKDGSVYTTNTPVDQIMQHTSGKEIPTSIASSVAVPHSVGIPLYYTAIHSDCSRNPHSSSVTTTKPYAIVNALPVQSHDGTYRPIAVSQKPGNRHLIQVVPTSDVSQFMPENIQHCAYIPSESVDSPLPTAVVPPPYSADATAIKTIDKNIQSIQKKIGDAFSSSNEKDLISAFEDAWRQFQENAKKYKKDSDGEKLKVLSDSIVLTKTDKEPKVQGTSQVNLAHQMSTKTRVVAPKLSSNKTQISTALPNSSTPQFIHAALTPGGTQQQIVIHPEYGTVYAIPTTGSANKLVHATGLYNPATAVATTTSSQSQHSLSKSNLALKTMVSRQRVIHDRAQVATSHRPSPRPQTKHGKKAKLCARCGENATYLCSGCHTEWYCGRECQLKAWESHADHCKA